MTETKTPVINMDNVPLRDSVHGETFAAKVGSLGASIGSTGIGATLHVVEPGKRAYPFHAHHLTHELFLILEGEGTYRFGDQTYPVRGQRCPGGALPAGRRRRIRSSTPGTVTLEISGCFGFAGKHGCRGLSRQRQVCRQFALRLADQIGRRPFRWTKRTKPRLLGRRNLSGARPEARGRSLVLRACFENGYLPVPHFCSRQPWGPTITLRLGGRRRGRHHQIIWLDGEPIKD